MIFGTQMHKKVHDSVTRVPERPATNQPQCINDYVYFYPALKKKIIAKFESLHVMCIFIFILLLIFIYFFKTVV